MNASQSKFLLVKANPILWFEKKTIWKIEVLIE